MTAARECQEFDLADPHEVVALLAAIDDRIAHLGRWVNRGGEALAGFWVPGTGDFHRDSLPDSSGENSATSTYRALVALTEFLRVTQEPNGVDATTDVREGARECVSAVANQWVAPLPKQLAELRGKSTNNVNMFTDSQLLMSAAMVGAIAAHAELPELASDAPKIQAAVFSGVGKPTIKRLETWRGGKVSESDAVHDFVTLHAIRGLDALHATASKGSTWKADASLDRESLRGPVGARVAGDVLKQLGYREAGIGSRFDPAELVFSAALLERMAPSEAPQLLAPAVRAVVEGQTMDGAWPTARIVSYGTSNRLLHVASFEVALTLTGVMSQQVRLGDLPLALSLIAPLDRSFGLVESAYTQADGLAGWANDRIRWSSLVECWATAVVLSFLIRYRDVLLDLRQRIVLRKYRSSTPPRSMTRLRWPDLYAALRGPKQLAESALDRVSDPSADHQIVKALKSHYLEPTLASSVRRPSSTSLLIWGPPGTRKTTLVSQLAKALDWPLVTLSPPAFLRQGLDGLEAAADEVFSDLLRLRRVVVLFDECEDFFKKRNDNAAQADARTLGAFITSGMLPRLQKLHDNMAIIFVLATNVRPESLDTAVTRPGRFDYSLFLGHPVLSSQKAYLRSFASDRLKPEHTEVIEQALDAFDANLEGVDRRGSIGIGPIDDASEMPLSFAVVEQIVRRVHGGDLEPEIQTIVEFARGVVQTGPRALV